MPRQAAPCRAVALETTDADAAPALANGVPRFRLEDLLRRPAEVIDAFRKMQVVRLDAASVLCSHSSGPTGGAAMEAASKGGQRGGSPTFCSLQELFADRPRAVGATWCQENSSRAPNGRPVTAATVLGGSQRPKGSWYASFIVQEPQALQQVLAALPLSQLELGSGPVRLRQSPALWFFIGQNIDRKGPLAGRPEHTDALTQSGTWHLQVSGTKVWCIRPTAELLSHLRTHFKDGSSASYALRSKVSQRGADAHPPKRRRGCTDSKSSNGSWDPSPQQLSPILAMLQRGAPPTSIRLDCEPGEVLLINTRLWYHCTELPSTRNAAGMLSISYARDFDLLCSRDSASDAKQTSAHETSREVVVAESPENEQSDLTNVDGLYGKPSMDQCNVFSSCISTLMGEI